ncbi:hypothetical protein [Salinirubrum litoreum]|uniref:DUF3829 domain-containing protein n=1 Tax=Salinirubrum litoreum TaxID=1126234 RepID=A0ABD5RBF9_9EURY|nr:hypothetical protein [Salinirubrum litoreum]
MFRRSLLAALAALTAGCSDAVVPTETPTTTDAETTTRTETSTSPTTTASPTEEPTEEPTTPRPTVAERIETAQSLIDAAVADYRSYGDGGFAGAVTAGTTMFDPAPITRSLAAASRELDAVDAADPPPTPDERTTIQRLRTWLAFFRAVVETVPAYVACLRSARRVAARTFEGPDSSARRELDALTDAVDRAEAGYDAVVRTGSRLSRSVTELVADVSLEQARRKVDRLADELEAADALRAGYTTTLSERDDFADALATLDDEQFGTAAFRFRVVADRFRRAERRLTARPAPGAFASLVTDLACYTGAFADAAASYADAATAYGDARTADADLFVSDARAALSRAGACVA